MNSFIGSRLTGATIVTAACAATLLLSTAIVSAQQADSTALFGDEVLELMLESRLQKPASDATAQERAAAIDELTNIYMVTNLPRAVEMAESPEVKAQIDLQGRAILFNAFANEYLANNQATEQEVFNMYEEQIALSPANEFKARHILVETQGEAMSLIEELQGGAEFTKLAEERSTGPSASTGGDLGWFTAQAMVKPFSDAVSTMEDGEFTTSPVQTQFGWHVILREDSRDGSPPPLDSVRDVIQQRVAQQKFQEYMKSLRSKASE